MGNFNHQGNYKCECGKEFDNSQAFNGHKSHCKIHLGETKYLENLNIFKNSFSLGLSSRVNKLKLTKEEQLDKWISEKHVCEHCGKVMTEKFGSGRFCSISCANSKVHSSETKEKISKSLRNSTKVKRKHDASKKYYCKICGKEISYKNKSGCCGNCYRHSPISEEQKIKQSLTMAGRSRWNIHRNQSSYSELFFENVLNNNNIKFEREFQIKREDNYHCYYLDFKIGDNFDLEIDGKQHQYRKEEDLIRDNYLRSIGYTVYRIEWNDINSEAGKTLMKEKIDDLLKVLKDAALV